MPRRNGYAKGALSKEVILDAAVELFGLNGYTGTSLRDVARHSGLTHSGLLHHFPNKVALLTAVIDRKDRQSHERAANERREDGSSSPDFMDLLEENVARPELTRLFTRLAAEATNVDHPGNEYFVARYRWIHGVARSIMVASQEAGTMRSDIDPDLAARMVVALMDGAQLQWLLELDRDEVKVDMPAILAEFLKVLRVNPN